MVNLRPLGVVLYPRDLAFEQIAISAAMGTVLLNIFYSSQGKIKDRAERKAMFSPLDGNSNCYTNCSIRSSMKNAYAISDYIIGW